MKKRRLIGKTKKEVLVELGDGFNFYKDREWTYLLKKNWWGRRTVLFIEFDQEDIVIAEYTISKYGKN